jgi:hypothetical protein
LKKKIFRKSPGELRIDKKPLSLGKVL